MRIGREKKEKMKMRSSQKIVSFDDGRERC